MKNRPVSRAAPPLGTICYVLVNFRPALRRSGACDSADPATLRCVGVDRGSRRTLDASEATRFEVFSLTAILLAPITVGRDNREPISRFRLTFQPIENNLVLSHCDRSRLH